MASFVDETLKFVFTTLSIFCMGFGLTIIVMCCGTNWDLVTNEKITVIPLSVFGITAFVISIFGCYAIFRGNMWLIGMCAVVLITALLGNFVVLIKHIKDIDLETQLKETFDAIWHVNFAIGKVMETFEKMYHCCGVNDYNDYEEAGLNMTDSCFDVGLQLKTDGCREVVLKEAKKEKNTIIILTSGNIAVQFVTTLLCIVILSRSLTKKKPVVSNSS